VPAVVFPFVHIQTARQSQPSSPRQECNEDYIGTHRKNFTHIGSHFGAPCGRLKHRQRESTAPVVARIKRRER
jgi:hypothetical protein